MFINPFLIDLWFFYNIYRTRLLVFYVILSVCSNSCHQYLIFDRVINYSIYDWYHLCYLYQTLNLQNGCRTILFYCCVVDMRNSLLLCHYHFCFTFYFLFVCILHSDLNCVRARAYPIIPPGFKNRAHAICRIRLSDSIQLCIYYIYVTRIPFIVFQTEKACNILLYIFIYIP